ncbi:MAG: hypothetical protein LH632_10260 [Rhodoferax sp.]|nr:hypothetical protein [Rhodoferax sp.]
MAGDLVQKGQYAGFLHFIEDVDHPQLELIYGASGVLSMAAGPGRLERGDCVAVGMQDDAEPEV